MNVSEAMQLLKEKGYKNTDKREELLRIFAENKRYLTAKDVLAAMNQKFSNLSYDTIYRNLSMFTQLGILEATDLSGEKHFRFSCGIDEHHHHFICTDCGVTKEIMNCPMESVAKSLQGFIVSGHKFEIYGQCPVCQGN